MYTLLYNISIIQIHCLFDVYIFIYVLLKICIFSENVGLDKFLSNNTSEDNQSFNEIIKEAEIQYQKKVLNYEYYQKILK